MASLKERLAGRYVLYIRSNSAGSWPPMLFSSVLFSEEQLDFMCRHPTLNKGKDGLSNEERAIVKCIDNVVYHPFDSHLRLDNNSDVVNGARPIGLVFHDFAV